MDGAFGALTDWMGLLANGLTVIAGVVAGVLAVMTARGRNPILEWTLRSERMRALWPLIRDAGGSRAVLRRESQQAARQVLREGAAPQAQTELDWLNHVASLGVPGFKLPLVLNGLTCSDSVEEELNGLADAYDRFSRRLRSRGLLSPNPVMEEQCLMAANTARLLRGNANYAAIELSQPGPIALHLPASETTLTLRIYLAGTEPHHTIDDVAVTHLHRRMVVAGTDGVETAHRDGVATETLRLSEEEVRRLARHMVGRNFDGVLPALVDARLQRDGSSGRTRLHVTLEEATYTAVVATHYVGGHGVGRSRDQLAADRARSARLLTESLLPITRDGYLLCAVRSPDIAIGAGRVSPAVNGNLELRDRQGVPVDRDRDGVPDLLLALCREAREEIAVSVDRQQLRVHGLVEFAYEEEVGSTALITSCRLDSNADEVVRAAAGADVSEGHWELEGAFLAVPLRERPEDIDRVLAWTLTATNHVPHLSAGIVALLLPSIAGQIGLDAAVRHLESLASGPASQDPPPGTRTIRRPG